MIKILKPLAGRIVPVPEYGYKALPVEGLELQLTPYWHNRINDGDVIIDEVEVVSINKKLKVESV
jgi:hypothetical protein